MKFKSEGKKNKKYKERDFLIIKLINIYYPKGINHGHNKNGHSCIFYLCFYMNQNLHLI